MSAPPLRDGDLVTLFGLTRRDDLNGITGSLLKMAVAAPAVRWLVQMRDSDEVISVLEANIILATDYDTDDGYNTTRVSKRQRSAPSQAADPVARAPSHDDQFLVPDPPPPPIEFVRAKQEARAKSKPPGTHRSSRMAHWGPREHNALRHGCSEAVTYDVTIDDARLVHERWIATEKFDGIRAVWDPAHADGPGFRTRSGSHFVPPASFAALLPPDMMLDGELWAGRRNFSAVGSLVGSKSLDGGRWHGTAWQHLTYVVFDAPRAGGGYLERIERARLRLQSLKSDRVVMAPTMPVASTAAKEALLEKVISAGGEGLVLRLASAPWRVGKDGRNVLKLKQWLDAEAVVLDNRPAPEASKLPTVVLRALNAPHMDNTSLFEIAVSRESRPLPPGTIVTFIYRQISKASGQPSTAGGAARIDKVHDSETCDCEFCSTAAGALREEDRIAGGLR